MKALILSPTKIMLSLLIVFAFGKGSAQRILYTSQDLNQPYNGQPIVSIKPHWLSANFTSTITIAYKDGKKQKIDRDSIWGFESNDHKLYRCYQKDMYEVKHIDDLLMYVQVASRYSVIRYGKTLDGPLYATKSKARKAISVNP